MLTVFDSLTNPIGERKNGKPGNELDWEDWFSQLQVPKIVDIPTKEARAEQVGGWSAALFENNHRLEKAAEKVTALVLDYDHLQKYEAIVELYKQYYGFIHSTFQHSDTAPRVRVILPFDRAVTPDEYSLIWKYFADVASKAGQEVDKACKNASRFWFYPCIAKGREYEYYKLNGGIVEVGEYLEKARNEVDVSAYGEKALIDAVAKVVGAGNGTRNQTLNNEGYSIAQLVAGKELDLEQACGALENAAKTIGLGKQEIEHTLTNAFRAGMQTPRTAPTPLAPVARAYSGKLDIRSSAALFAPLPPPKFVVEGLIPESSLCVLGAYGGTGKTWMTISLMLAIATGSQWLNRFHCKSGKVLFIDYENGEYETRRRLRKCYAGMGLESPPEYFDYVSIPPINLTSPDMVQRFEEVAVGRTLIVIDSLKAATPGMEESNANFRSGLDSLKGIAERTKCTFMVIHHARKNNTVERDAVPADPREMFRGSSAIVDASDNAILLRRTPEKGKIRVDHAKGRCGVEIDPFVMSIEDSEDYEKIFITAEELNPDAMIEDPIEKACDVVQRMVRKHGGEGMDSIAVRAASYGVSSKACGVAIARLVRDDSLYTQVEGKDVTYFVR